jgi:hypothetical protein
VNEHGIAGLECQLLLGQRLLEILRCDLVVLCEHRHAFVCGDIDQYAARDQRAYLLHPKSREAGATRRFLQREAVVHARADHLVAERVELRADLTDLGHDQLFVRTAMVRARIDAGALRENLEASTCGHRHRLRQHAAKLEDLAGLDQPRGFEHALGLHVIARATLIAFAPFRWTSLSIGRRRPRLRRGRAAGDEHRSHDECSHAHSHPLQFQHIAHDAMQRAVLSLRPRAGQGPSEPDISYGSPCVRVD